MKEQNCSRSERKSSNPKKMKQNSVKIIFRRLKRLKKLLVPESVLAEYCVDRILRKQQKYSQLFVSGGFDKQRREDFCD